MTEDSHPSSAGERSNSVQTPSDPSVEALRDILLGHHRDRVAELEAELDDVEQRISDEDALIAMITPVLGDAIRRKIRDSREEMIEALYPIIGQLVVRAVSEAIQDLAQSLDAQVRTSFSPQIVWWRLRARIGGASEAEIRLRELLPFRVTEVFLIHRETGLLLRHSSRDPEASADSDLISGMLTAIRDFAQDAFGRGREGQLEEIEYGDRHILIEAAQHTYLAVVVDGTAPPGFRADMRRRLIDIESQHIDALRDYDGDATPLASASEMLDPLMEPAEPASLSSGQKRLLAAVFGLALLVLVFGCAGVSWVWREVRGSQPAAVPVAVMSTSTPTLTLSATPATEPSPTYTATPPPTFTPTATLTATPAPVTGMTVGSVWLREGPSESAPRLGLILQQGQRVKILAGHGDWYRVRWTAAADSEAVGWVPARSLEPVMPVPAGTVTPSFD